MTTIYTLADRDGNVRYVGKTDLPIAVRLTRHMYDKSNNHKVHWIQSLGYTPTIDALEVVPSDLGDDAEIFWISQLRFLGCRLVNTLAGGTGASKGVRRSAESRARMSAAAKGRPPISNVTREKLRALAIARNTGRVVSQATREKIRRTLAATRKAQEMSKI